MSMSIKGAFNYILTMHGRIVTVIRPGTPTDTSVVVKAALSNYFRKLDGPADTTIKGREMVLSKEALENSLFPTPIRRGDRVNHPDIGILSITEVSEMNDVGGEIIGYRVRTG